jgi:hypothetical protein
LPWKDFLFRRNELISGGNYTQIKRDKNGKICYARGGKSANLLRTDQCSATQQRFSFPDIFPGQSHA